MPVSKWFVKWLLFRLWMFHEFEPYDNHSRIRLSTPVGRHKGNERLQDDDTRSTTNLFLAHNRNACGIVPVPRNRSQLTSGHLSEGMKLG